MKDAIHERISELMRVLDTLNVMTRDGKVPPIVQAHVLVDVDAACTAFNKLLGVVWASNTPPAANRKDGSHGK